MYFENVWRTTRCLLCCTRTILCVLSIWIVSFTRIRLSALCPHQMIFEFSFLLLIGHGKLVGWFNVEVFLCVLFLIYGQCEFRPRCTIELMQNWILIPIVTEIHKLTTDLNWTYLCSFLRKPVRFITYGIFGVSFYCITGVCMLYVHVGKRKVDNFKICPTYAWLCLDIHRNSIWSVTANTNKKYKYE